MAEKSEQGGAEPLVEDTGGCPATSSAEGDPLVGKRLGSYVLEEELGAGGMCVVYRARHVDLGSEFAVKVLHPKRVPQEVFTQRLRREAAAGLRLNHPNVVKVIELGMGPRGPFLVMELLRGATLHDVVQRRGPLSPISAAKIVRQTADGLGAAHRAGFIHRDLKPGNIMLVPSEKGDDVKILDLGIVGVTNGDPGEHLTRDNLVVGTPAYMAPEQFHGSSFAGPQADLYSLGIVLYQMLTGWPPFQGSFQEIIAQHMMTPPDALPSSEGLEELAYWLLEKSAGNRPKSAAEVMAFIDQRFPTCMESATTTRAPATRLEAPPIPLPVPMATVGPQRSRSSPAGVSGSGAGRPHRSSSSQPRFSAPWRSRFSAGSRFKPQRRLRWPLRVAISAVWSLAVVGGAFATQRLLLSRDGAPRTTVMIEHRVPVAVMPSMALSGEAQAHVAVAEPARAADPAILEAPAQTMRERPTKQAPAAKALDRKLHEVVRALAVLADQNKVARAELEAFEDWYLGLAQSADAEISETEAKLLIARTDLLLGRMRRLMR